jgi:hypothetical protein
VKQASENKYDKRQIFLKTLLLCRKSGIGYNFSLGTWAFALLSFSELFLPNLPPFYNWN